MSRITWDQNGARLYEVGVDHGVLYLASGDEYISGVPWNGLISVDGNVEDAGKTEMYSGDIKVTTLSTYGAYSGTITAYTYPDEFEDCIGSTEVIAGIFLQHQEASRFGLSYRSLIGNDTNGQDHGYKIHLIYNLEVQDIAINRSTISDTPETTEFAWDVEAVPVVLDDYEPFSEIIIDSTKFSSESMALLEDILYGTAEEDPRLPSFDELMDLFYVPDPIPEEYEGYPYPDLYPATDIYPYGPYPGASSLSFSIVFNDTLEPTHSSILVLPAPYTPESSTYIPPTATLLDVVHSAIPEEYTGLSLTVSLNDSYNSVSAMLTNNSDSTMTISGLEIEVTIYYTEEEET